MKNKNAVKKFISLVLGLVMVLGLTIPVMADWVILNPNGEPYFLVGWEGQDTESRPTIQVTLVSDEPIRHWDMEEHIWHLPLGTQMIIELFPASGADIQLESATVELGIATGNATRHEETESYGEETWTTHWYVHEYVYTTLLSYNQVVPEFNTARRIVHVFDTPGQFYIRPHLEVWQQRQGGSVMGNAMPDDGRPPTLIVGGGLRQIEEQPTDGTAPNLSAASTWAHDGINQAFALGLIPQSLQNSYTANATRAEFSALAVALYETVTGREITGRMQFNDTNDINVQKMGYLGVVTGVGGGNFAPDRGLTRQEAAVMIARLANVMGQPLSPSAPTFSDNASISSWAVEAVGQIQAAGIMGGVGNNQFAPQGDYTREQSIITMLRLFDLLS